MIRTIIFDVDGTLLDTEKIYMEAWRQAGALFGYPIPEPALKQTRAVNKTIALEVFRKYCGQDFPYEKIQKERIVIAERIINESTAEQLHKPHVVAVLERLKGEGYTMAVASSTEQSKTEEHLRHAGLLGYFPVVVGGDMVERGKPNPDIFLKAAELAGAKAEECLVVGDTPADVFAATAAGMPVVLIPDQVPANEETTALSLRVLEHLGQLPDVLNQ